MHSVGVWSSNDVGRKIQNSIERKCAKKRIKYILRKEIGKIQKVRSLLRKKK